MKQLPLSIPFLRQRGKWCTTTISCNQMVDHLPQGNRFKEFALWGLDFLFIYYFLKHSKSFFWVESSHSIHKLQSFSRLFLGDHYLFLTQKQLEDFSFCKTTTGISDQLGCSGNQFQILCKVSVLAGPSSHAKLHITTARPLQCSYKPTRPTEKFLPS